MKGLIFRLPAILVLAVSLLVNCGRAQEKPIQLSLVSPVQLYNPGTAIAGLRYNIIYGRNTSITGLDIGFINHTTTGISTCGQFGAVGFNEGSFTGLQSNIANITEGNVLGLQWGFINYAGSVNGIQLGVINFAVNLKKGLQIGFVNIAKRGGQFPVFPIVNWAF